MNLELANKEKVRKEYITRAKKIWKSELSSFNKVIAHNACTIPVLTTAGRINNWTIEEIKQIDTNSVT